MPYRLSGAGDLQTQFFASFKLPFPLYSSVFLQYLNGLSFLSRGIVSIGLHAPFPDDLQNVMTRQFSIFFIFRDKQGILKLPDIIAFQFSESRRVVGKWGVCACHFLI